MAAVLPGDVPESGEHRGEEDHRGPPRGGLQPGLLSRLVHGRGPGLHQLPEEIDPAPAGGTAILTLPLLIFESSRSCSKH